MKKLSVIILASILSFSTFSCGDDDSDNEVETLTGGTWKLVSLNLNGEDVTSTDLDECDLMDFYIFNEDNTFTFTGHEKIDDSEDCSESTASGIWRDSDLSSNGNPFFEAAFEGDDIESEEERLNLRIEDKILRERVEERNDDGTTEAFDFFYEKQ